MEQAKKLTKERFTLLKDTLDGLINRGAITGEQREKLKGMESTLESLVADWEKWAMTEEDKK